MDHGIRWREAGIVISKPKTVRAWMPKRTGQVNAVVPRRSFKDLSYLGMLLMESAEHERSMSHC
jgi:hypothetical protein